MAKRNRKTAKEKTGKIAPQRKAPPVSAAVNSLLDRAPSKTDPDGSYTGRPREKSEIPVQDADDL